MERYEEHDGCYVLYIGKVKAATSERIAVLLDAERGCLITHCDPQEVRRELDALRAVEPQRTAAWLLLEGRPALATLNQALLGDVDIHNLHLAFTQASARRVLGELMARLRRGKT
jgi:hypothetical protein